MFTTVISQAPLKVLIQCLHDLKFDNVVMTEEQETSCKFHAIKEMSLIPHSTGYLFLEGVILPFQLLEG